MLSRIAAALVITVSCLVFLVVPLQANHAECASIYVVQPGDTLTFIARDFDLSVSDLVKVNHIRNLNLIKVGQELCIPPIPTPTPTLPLPLDINAASADLVVEYVWVQGVVEPDSPFQVSRDRTAGRRIRFPLQISGVLTYTVLDDVFNHSIGKNPLFWVARTQRSEPFSYTLVVIGDPELVTGLVLSETVSISQVFPHHADIEAAAAVADFGTPPQPTYLSVREALVDNGVGQPEKIESVRLWLRVISESGAYFSVEIANIDYWPSVAAAAEKYAFPTFALNRSNDPGTDDYQLMVHIQSDGSAGIPGNVRTAACNRWASGPWWQQLMRQVYC